MDHKQWLVAGLVGVIVLVGGGFLLTQQNDSKHQADVTEAPSVPETPPVTPDMATAGVGLATDPTISLSASEVTQGTPIIVTWDKNTASTLPCYYLTTPMGFGGTIPTTTPFKIETANKTGNGNVVVYCKSLAGGFNFSKTLQFFIRPVNPKPSVATAPIVQAQLTGSAIRFGDKIAFKWNAMGGKDCTYVIPAARVVAPLDSDSTTFTIDSSSFYRSLSPIYGLRVVCQQKSGSSLSSDFTFWQMAS